MPDRLFIIFVLMNEVELLVHGREVTLEQQKAVHARVIWYVPCITTALQQRVAVLSPAVIVVEVVLNLAAMFVCLFTSTQKLTPYVLL